MVRVDMTGMRFGQLEVIGFDKIQGKSSRWICRCDCGRTTSVFRVSLMKRSGATTSCGCYRNKCVSNRNTTHGMSAVGSIKPEYRAWANMKDRCNNQTNKRFPHYGGRGISYCNQWTSFENFFEDMGPRPSKRHSLDRIDNDKGYSKENCRWATCDIQNGNRSTVRLITAFGKTLSANQWSKISGVQRSTIIRRLNRGVSAEDAIGHIKPSAL